jgi:Family of unknown function (DUF6152)
MDPRHQSAVWQAIRQLRSQDELALMNEDDRKRNVRQFLAKTCRELLTSQQRGPTLPLIGTWEVGAMRHRWCVSGLAAVWLLIVPALHAHHSVSGQFDLNKPIVLKGVISKVDWINPHVYLHLDVKEADGTTTRWALSTLPTAMMRRAGLTKESISGAEGEVVTIDAIPARDGTKHLGWINKITYADGHTFAPTGQ